VFSRNFVQINVNSRFFEVKRLVEAGFDLIIPRVKWVVQGCVGFRSKLRPVIPVVAQWDPLQILTEECRNASIKVHPYMCVFNEGEDSAFLKQHPEFQAVGPEGTLLNWSCPSRYEVQNHLLALYEEIIDNYDVAGVHMDYIRYDDDNMCFCTHYREAFKRRYREDALAVHSGGYGKHFWMDFREENIRRFVRSMRKLTAERGKELSAATWSTYLWGKEGYGQDWCAWAREGLLDLSCPMDYTNSLDDLKDLIPGQLAAVEGKCPLWVGIGKKSSHSDLSPQQFAEQILLCRQLGADGITVFSHVALTDEDLALLKRL